MGGHEGLNILPQKSWNVYGRKQRERVREASNGRRQKKRRKKRRRRERRLQRCEERKKKKVRRRDWTGEFDAQTRELFEYHEKALESLEKKQKAKKSEEDEGNQLGGNGSVEAAVVCEIDYFVYDDDDDDDDDNEDKKYGRRHYSLPKRVRMQREETERLRLADKNNAPRQAKNSH